MEDLTARARLVDASELGAQGITATVPRRQVEEALAAEDGPGDLILDVERADDGGGRRIAVEWDRGDLERLLRQAEDDAIVFAFDREPLARAFDDDVEAHGLREKALVLTVAAATAAGAAGAAQAYPDPGEGTTSSGAAAYTAIESARSGAAFDERSLSGASAIEAARSQATQAGEAREYGLPQPTAADYAAAQGVEAGDYGMPQATAADYAAAQGVEAGEYGMPQASPAAEAAAARAAEGGPAAYSGVEAARAAEASSDALLSGYAGIDTVGAEVAAELGTGQGPAAHSAVESARASEPAPTTGDATGGGVTIDAPSPATTAALAGAAALAITGAAFAARSRRRLTPSS